MPEEKLPIGTLGISLEDIDTGETGQAYFPDLNLRAEVYAVENIRKHRDIIIVAANNQAKEHSPVELSYQTLTEKWQRVTEGHPLPVLDTYKGVTTFAEDYTNAQSQANIITPTSGMKIRVVSVYVSTYSTTADVVIEFATSGKKILKLYTAHQQTASMVMNVSGEADEPVSLTCGASTFVLINYVEEP